MDGYKFNPVPHYWEDSYAYTNKQLTLDMIIGSTTMERIITVKAEVWSIS